MQATGQGLACVGRERQERDQGFGLPGKVYPHLIEHGGTAAHLAETHRLAQTYDRLKRRKRAVACPPYGVIFGDGRQGAHFLSWE